MPATSSAQLFLVDSVNVDDAALAKSSAWLSAGEAARYRGFVRPHRQRQFLIGRTLLRMALAELLGCAPEALLFEQLAGRAPRLLKPAPGKGGAAPGFSISHSGQWVACAVSADTALGLDIEVLDPARDIDALAEHAFDDATHARWRAAAPAQRMAQFYRLWSEREARLKLGQSPGEPAPGCLVLPHPELSVVLCSALPLAVAPRIELRAL
ncbi:4'-phosphopantetheinyl transferase family protein [Rugamonas sp. DEMB1]|uniref:4'-phosphopantetheinyl transferase family protein n=1 Tax=Rugamonas sp. DEMB1 TaxID=3039386 RepID=UPI00244C25DB|nr:4'-phosphopantetheinyl transferase superfamily protein [Rugamonas sp. DEMB1]WGG51932.1 4-phosphopantetheinyl transferase [Rugamonas sp. DEMB1]